MLRRAFSTLVSCAGLVLACASCDREDIRVYTVAKESPEAPPDAAGDSAPAQRPPPPKISSSLPTGWQQLPGSGMNLASFAIKTDAGEATVNVTALAGMAGRDLEIVNLWRQQVGQEPLPEAELGQTLTPVEIGGESGQLFEIAGRAGDQTRRILTAFVHRADGSWFYKMQGAGPVVAEQKPAFIEFLRSVRVEAPAVAENEAAPSRFAWSVPPGWQPVPPGTMQVAKFELPAQGGAKAEVAVSIFPSDTGGILANVNRWRKQLGLPEVDDAGLKSDVTPLEGAPDAVLADLENGERRLIGAIVPRSGQWWFYKMTGNAASVRAGRDEFIRFATSRP